LRSVKNDIQSRFLVLFIGKERERKVPKAEH